MLCHVYYGMVLAVTTPFSNLTVLIVFCINRKLINGQAVYRIPLGISDFFTGITVFPSFIIYDIAVRLISNTDITLIKNC